MFVNKHCKSIKIDATFIKDGKPPISKLNSCNYIYQFKCPCLKSYIGRTKRVLRIRAQENTFSRAKKTYYHLHRCPIYIKKLQEYEKINLPPKAGAHLTTKIRDNFFMGYFKGVLVAGIEFFR
jgi:hypothetical protein